MNARAADRSLARRRVKSRPRRRHRLRTAHRRRAPPAVEIVVASPLWRARRGCRPLLRRAIAAASRMTPAIAGDLAIVLTDDTAIRTLNRVWRRRDAPTNVLSFPAADGFLATLPASDLGTGSRRRAAPTRPLGDIVIAYETTAREARAGHKHFAHHLAHLAVHGFLHLAGYDHGSEHEADVMEGLEIAILARLSVPDPYGGRAAGR
jgi:probable rRNA maturation factor